MRKILPLQGFDPRTVQPAASRYTDYAIPTHIIIIVIIIVGLLLWLLFITNSILHKRICRRVCYVGYLHTTLHMSKAGVSLNIAIKLKGNTNFTQLPFSVTLYKVLFECLLPNASSESC
jgi:hypothetical protein